MKTFMLFCFLILGLAFFQLSGGSEFEPERRVVAEVDPIVEDVDLPETTERALVQPNETTATDGSIQERLSRALVTPEVIAVSLETTTPEPTTIEVAEVEEPLVRSLTERLTETPEVAPATEQSLSLDLRQVASSRVNMRNGPGTDFSVLVTLNSGTATEVIDSNGDGWVRVRVRDTGQEGWMAEYLLEPISG